MTLVVCQITSPIKATQQTSSRLCSRTKEQVMKKRSYCCQPPPQLFPGPFLWTCKRISSAYIKFHKGQHTTSRVSFLWEHILSPNRPCGDCCHNATEDLRQLVDNHGWRSAMRVHTDDCFLWGNLATSLYIVPTKSNVPSNSEPCLKESAFWDFSSCGGEVNDVRQVRFWKSSLKSVVFRKQMKSAPELRDDSSH